ncbi:hemolysin family protein [Rhizobium sp. G187]|uniref:hemolysin family protein n=1 Tax=Rhizobium sp. G187 TaxID=3451352 RepID=UPI003EE762CB
MFTEIAIVVFLTLLNGILAMSELAVVSSRPVRLRILADQGSRGAAIAIGLAQDPGRFLSTVQIGITLVGVLSGAFSGATLGGRLAGWLELQGLSASLANGLGVGSVVVAITYLSLIVGELVPKQIALRAPEAVAVKVAPAMALLSRVALPLVWLLNASGKLVLALLGQSGQSEEKMTDEEVRTVIAEAHSAGVIEAGEQEMISGVMRLADRTARGLMTPRRDVEVIDLEHDPAEIREQLRHTQRSRLPLRNGTSDEIVGVVAVKDALDAWLEGREVDLLALAREAPVVSDRSSALTVIEQLRKAPARMVLVYDEYGHFEGVVSSGDVLEAITGVLEDEETGEPALVSRADGSLLVSGWMPIDEFADEIGLTFQREPDYETVAGFVIETLRHLPSLGESFSVDGWHFEVVDMDGRRVDKLIVRRQAE